MLLFGIDFIWNVTLFAKAILKYSWCQQRKADLLWANYREKCASIGDRNMISIKIPVDCHVEFEGLQSKIIS